MGRGDFELLKTAGLDVIIVCWFVHVAHLLHFAQALQTH